MINDKPNVVKAIKKYYKDNVYTSYPSKWTSFPIIVYTEEDNIGVYETLNNEETGCILKYKIDIWEKDKSTSDVALKINTIMSELGFKRKNSIDTPDPSGLKHKVMRFQKIINN